MKTMFRILGIAVLCVALLAGLWSAAPTRGENNAQAASWAVQIFSDPNLSTFLCGGTLVGPINFPTTTWGTGGPVIPGTTCGALPTDNFSVRFTTTTFFTAGTYRFSLGVDDGARLYVDGNLLINQWTGGPFRTFTADFLIGIDGNHTIMVEMFDQTLESGVVLSWALISGPILTPTSFVPGVPWYGEFFNNPDLAGSPVFATTYQPSGLNLNWGQGSPGGAVPVDNFSARFTRPLNVPTDLPQAVYIFHARADDNFRFYVDSALIIDRWGEFAGQQNVTAEVTLLNGPHVLKVEYRDFSSDAFVFLTWVPPYAQNPILNPDGSSTGPGGTPIPGVTPATATPAQTGVIATVNVNVLNFRSAPDLNATVITQLSKGTSYPVTGRTGDSQWLQLNVNNQLGWVMAQFVTLAGDINRVPVISGPTPTVGPPAPTLPPASAKGRVLGNLRIRQGPSTRTARIGLIPWGTVVDILGRDQGHSWYQVNYNGLIGWAFAPWIEIIEGSFDLLPYTDGSGLQVVAPPTQGVIIQAYGNMRVRSGPGFQFPRIGKVVWGTRVEALARSTDGLWYKIRHGDLVGWSFATWYRPVQGNVGALPVSNQ